MSTLHAMQSEWAAHLRAPMQAPMPAHTAPARMALYGELLSRNISGFMHQCFPVCRSMLPAQEWQNRIDIFFAEAKNASPYFHEIPGQFVDFWQARIDALQQPSWFTELLHYEWLELAVDTAPDAAPHYGPQGLALNPTLQLAGYEWPVHTISADNLPPTPQSTFLALHRNSVHRVQFTLLTPAAMQLLMLLQGNGCNWQAANTALAELLHKDLAQVQTTTQALQQQWLQTGLMLARD